MQIFVIGSIYETAISLDRKRFHNQITEARITLDCLKGLNGWGRHPLMKMYKGCEKWLELYIKIFKLYRDGYDDYAYILSEIADHIKPQWFTEDFFNKHKSRLYTKNPTHYNQWAYLGESYSNWYRVDGVWKEYKQTH